MKIIIILTSKNLNSLNEFLKFFNYFLKKNNPEILKNLKITSKKTRFKKFSVLRSPHVHKQGQEQFELRKFSKKIVINRLLYPRFLVSLKKIKRVLFSDVRISIRYGTKHYVLAPNFFFNFTTNFSKKNTLSYLKELEHYGALKFKKHV